MNNASRLGRQGNAALLGIGLTDHKAKGRPAYHEEEYLKQNIILTASAADFLTDTVNAMKAKGRGARSNRVNMDRSKLIRGLLLGIKQAGYRLEDRGLRDEHQLAELVKSIFERALKAG